MNVYIDATRRNATQRTASDVNEPLPLTLTDAGRSLSK